MLKAIKGGSRELSKASPRNDACVRGGVHGVGKCSKIRVRAKPFRINPAVVKLRAATAERLKFEVKKRRQVSKSRTGAARAGSNNVVKNRG